MILVEIRIRDDAQGRTLSMKRKLGTFGFVLCALVLLGAGCADGSQEPVAGSQGSVDGSREPADGAGTQVEVVNIAYAPATLEISSGTEVTWTNQDEGVHHTATSGLPGDNGVPGVSKGKPARPDGVFDGDLPDAGEEFSFTFDEPGTYTYFCRIHPSMTAEVIVN